MAEGEGKKQRSEQKAKCILHCQRSLEREQCLRGQDSQNGYQPIKPSLSKEVNGMSRVTSDS